MRVVGISLDLLRKAESEQLSLFDNPVKQGKLSDVVDEIRLQYGETSIMRASSLLKAGQLMGQKQENWWSLHVMRGTFHEYKRRQHF